MFDFSGKWLLFRRLSGIMNLFMAEKAREWKMIVSAACFLH